MGSPGCPPVLRFWFLLPLTALVRGGGEGERLKRSEEKILKDKEKIKKKNK
jgi:hypothetical protein